MFELLVVGPVLSFCEGLLSVVFENHGVFVRVRYKCHDIKVRLYKC